MAKDKELFVEPGAYWIYEDEYRERESYIIANYNFQGQWKVNVNGSTKFISTYAMKLIFGKDFIVRAVDFEADKFEDEFPEDEKGFLQPFAINSTNNAGYGIIMKTQQFAFLDKIIIPGGLLDDGFFLKFNKAA